MRLVTHAISRAERRGFSLVEVLLAIFILGIGLIMVASVFPVGANWTRQTAEESVAQTVAQDAIAVLKTHYGPNGDLHAFVAPDFVIYNAGAYTPNAANQNSILQQQGAVVPGLNPFTLQALPGFITSGSSAGIPPSERAYQFGSANPFPAKSWDTCTYFWTAVARLSPEYKKPGAWAPGDPTNGILLSSSYKYDVYIMVFRKGSAEHVFTATPAGGVQEVPGTRDTAWGANASRVPSVWYATWNAGNHDPARTPQVYNAVPPMGQFGIGATSGTVFRQVLDTTINLSASGTGGATPRPQIINTPETILFSPAADGNVNSASPLVYVYQTTLTF